MAIANTILFANNAASLLAVAISNVETVLELTPGDGVRFPTISESYEYFYVTLQNGSTQEIVKVTGRSGDVLTVERAQDDTTAQTFAVGSSVAMRPVSAIFNKILFADNPNFTLDETGLKVALAVAIGDDLTVSGSAAIAGSMDINGSLDVGTSAIVRNSLEVVLALKVGDDAVIVGDAEVGNDLTVSKNAAVGGAMTVAGAVTLQTPGSGAGEAVAYDQFGLTDSANGEFTLPNGIVYMWGTGTLSGGSAAVVFSPAFGAVRSMSANRGGAAGVVASGSDLRIGSNLSTSGVTVYADASASGTFFWTAIGTRS